MPDRGKMLLGILSDRSWLEGQWGWESGKELTRHLVCAQQFYEVMWAGGGRICLETG